jgi:hypothetical protein
MNLSDYPENWPEVSRQIRERAGWKCEGTPHFPDCRAENGKPHPETGSKVILTVAHMDHDKSHADPARLRALCQRCHLDWDLEHHMANARRTRVIKRAGGDAAQPLPLAMEAN